VPALWHLDNPAREVTCVGCTYQTVQAAPPGLYFNGTLISNIFPFDRNGKPLDDVLLYLRDGRALNVDASRIDPKRRYLAKPSGGRLYNSFPVRFYQHIGSTQISKGWIRPSVHLPKLRIPPLDGQTP
jgi:hypothetical protein